MPNIYFLFGNDEFAITRKLKEFEADFTDPTSADMNTARLDARSASEDDLNNAVNAMPFLAKRRLVLLENISSKYNNASAHKKFLAFIEKTPETTRLVMYESVEPRDAERHWLVKWAEKNSKLIQTRTFMLPRLKDMTGWIVNETKNQGGKIEPRAAEMLKEMVGVDTRQAGMEIAKLLAYVNWARPVIPQDVEAVCVVTSQQSVFDFVDALANGNGKSAQHLLHRLPGRRGPSAGRSRAHVAVDSAQVCGGASGGVSEGEECDSHRADVWGTRAQFCGGALLGAGILGVDGG